MENNGAYEVLVYPHIDYVFIVALLLIIDKMELEVSNDFFTDLATGAILDWIAEIL